MSDERSIEDICSEALRAGAAAILEGRQPAGLYRQRLVLGDIPAAWADQRRLFDSA